MPSNEPGFAERLETAAKARKAQLEKLRATAPVPEAQPTTRQAAEADAAAARKSRTAERKEADRLVAKQKEADRAAETARRALALVEDKERREAEARAKVDADAARTKDQKAARDAKYAARKARQR